MKYMLTTMQDTKISRLSHNGGVFTGREDDFISKEEAEHLEDYIIHIALWDEIDAHVIARITNVLEKFPLLAVHLFTKQFVGLCARNMFTRSHLQSQYATLFDTISGGVNDYYRMFVPDLPIEALSKNEEVIELLVRYFGVYCNYDLTVFNWHCIAESNPKYFHDRFKELSDDFLSFNNQKSLRASLISDNYLHFWRVMRYLSNCSCFLKYMGDAVKFILTEQDDSSIIGQMCFLELCFQRSEDIASLNFLGDLIKRLLKIITGDSNEAFHLSACRLLLTLCINSPLQIVRNESTLNVHDNKQFWCYIKSELSKESGSLEPRVCCIAVTTGKVLNTYLTSKAITNFFISGLAKETCDISVSWFASCPGLVYRQLDDIDCFKYLSSAFHTFLTTSGKSLLENDRTVIKIYDTRITILYECMYHVFKNDAVENRIRQAHRDTVLAFVDLITILLDSILERQQIKTMTTFLLGMKWTSDQSVMDIFDR